MTNTGSTTRPYGGRSAGERRAERRERMLAAGLELFGTQGYAATPIQQLCAHAGVSTRNFYDEFAGRENLLIALHDQVITEAAQAVFAAFEQAGDAGVATRIELAVRAFVTTTASDPRWARLSYVEVIGVSPAVERHRLAWRARFSQLLIAESERAVERGEASAQDFRLGAVALIGAVNELVYHWSIGDGSDGSLEDVITEIVRLATAVITAA